MSVTTPGLGPWATEIPACGEFCGEFCILRTIREEVGCLQARNLSCFYRPAAQEATANDNAVMSCILYDCFNVGIPGKHTKFYSLYPGWPCWVLKDSCNGQLTVFTELCRGIRSRSPL